MKNGCLHCQYADKDPPIKKENPTKNNACAAYYTASGYILELSMTPNSDEGFAPIASMVSASVQAAE